MYKSLKEKFQSTLDKKTAVCEGPNTRVISAAAAANKGISIIFLVCRD